MTITTLSLPNEPFKNPLESLEQPENFFTILIVLYINSYTLIHFYSMRSLNIIPLFVLALATTSCEALWDTSTDVSPSGTVSVGVSSGYNPYYSNVYYNGPYYNAPYYTGPYYTGPYNNYIPGWNYAPAPPAAGPTRPGIAGNWNRPVGNIRPGNQTAPSQQPAQQPAAPSVNLPSSPSQVPNINGSNPGLVAPPQGSGLKLK